MNAFSRNIFSKYVFISKLFLFISLYIFITIYLSMCVTLNIMEYFMLKALYGDSRVV